MMTLQDIINKLSVTQYHQALSLNALVRHTGDILQELRDANGDQEKIKNLMVQCYASLAASNTVRANSPVRYLLGEGCDIFVPSNKFSSLKLAVNQILDCELLKIDSVRRERSSGLINHFLAMCVAISSIIGAQFLSNMAIQVGVYLTSASLVCVPFVSVAIMALCFKLTSLTPIPGSHKKHINTIAYIAAGIAAASLVVGSIYKAILPMITVGAALAGLYIGFRVANVAAKIVCYTAGALSLLSQTLLYGAGYAAGYMYGQVFVWMDYHLDEYFVSPNGLTGFNPGPATA